MRNLDFIISEQNIQKKTGCNFSGISPGTANYLRCRFSFSSEWAGYVKVAEFRKYAFSDPVSVPIYNNECYVPGEVTSGPSWKVRIVGKRKNIKITTCDCEVKQEGRYDHR